MKQIKTVLILLFIVVTINAQESYWNSNIEAWVEWMRPISNGNLIVECDKTMYCLNSEDGSIVWENGDLTGFELKDFKPILVTNLMQLGVTEPIIVNATTGKVIFKGMDSEMSSFLFKRVVADQQSILILGNSGKEAKLVLVNYETGEITWSTILGAKKKSGTNLTATYMSGSNVQNYDYDTKYTKDGNLLLTFNDLFFHIDFKTGAIIWEYESDEAAKKSFITPDNENVLLVSGDLAPKLTGGFNIELLNIASGDKVWKKKSYKGVFDKLYFEDGSAVIHGGRAFHKIDYMTGEDITKNYSAAYGMEVKEIIKSEDKYIIVKEKNANDYAVYYLDNDGIPIWKNGKQLPRVLDVQEKEDAIVFLTRSHFSVLDKVTGKHVKGASQYFGSVTAWKYVASEKAYYVFGTENNKLTKVYIDDYKAETIISNLIFDGEQVPNKLEINENGYLLMSQANICQVGKDGSIIFQKYYWSYDMNINKDLRSLASAKPLSLEGDSVNDVNYNTENTVDSSILEAYIKSLQQERNMVVIVSAGEGEDRHKVVTSISKETGEVINEVHLQKDVPKYYIDPINYILFYKSDQYEISAYKL